jgi:hypothetical protein
MELATTLRTGRNENRGSIPGGGRDHFFVNWLQIVSRAQPASYPTNNDRPFSQGKTVYARSTSIYPQKLGGTYISNGLHAYVIRRIVLNYLGTGTLYLVWHQTKDIFLLGLPDPWRWDRQVVRKRPYRTTTQPRVIPQKNTDLKTFTGFTLRPPYPWYICNMIAHTNTSTVLQRSGGADKNSSSPVGNKNQFRPAPTIQLPQQQPTFITSSISNYPFHELQPPPR